MTAESLLFLTSTAGKELLDKYSSITEGALQNLAFTLSKNGVMYAADIVTLLKLRIKAQDKFTKASRMYFTVDGFEQAGGEKVARHISKRFLRVIPHDSRVIDLTCGIGSDTIILGEYFKVTTVDRDPVHIECARLNAREYGSLDNVTFVNGNSEDCITKADAFFLDPQRLRHGATKTRSLANSSPNILEILPKMFEITPNICIKISPAFDYDELKDLPYEHEVEIISEKNGNKAALLWFGKFKTCERRATMLDGDISFSDMHIDQKILTSELPLKYIYEPNVAVIKARLIDEVAMKYGLQKINAQVALLTSDNYIENCKTILRSFEVIDTRPFSWRELKKLLSEKGIDRAHIITRRFPENAEDVRVKLKLKEGGEYTIILTVLSSEKRYFILTKSIVV